MRKGEQHCVWSGLLTGYKSRGIKSQHRRAQDRASRSTNVLLVRGERALLAHCHTCLGTGGYSVSTGQVERMLSHTHESVQSHTLASLHRMRESQGESGDTKLLSGD